MVIDGCAAMIPQLKGLWQLCFGDGADDVDYFFRYRYDRSECMVDWQDERVAAMLFLLPARTGGGKDVPAGYVYAFATHPDFRGRGIATGLLNCARRRMEARGGFTFLCPAQDSLYRFYAARGFKECYHVWACGGKIDSAGGKTQNDLMDCPAHTNIRLAACSAPEYWKLREGYLHAADIIWDAEAVDYAVLENGHSGGICRKICLPGGGFGAVLCRMDETPKENLLLSMRELLLPEEWGQIIPELAALLAAELGYGQSVAAGNPLCWRALSPERYTGARRQRIGMADQNHACGYLNLVLD